MRRRSAGLLAVIALVFVGCGGAVPEASEPSEGIQVHGDWTIEIYNEDGSLDQTVEFSNALQPGGEKLLVDLLLGSKSAGTFQIELGSDICDPSGICVMAATASDQSNSLILEGSTVVDNEGVVGQVGTRLGSCPPDTPPDVCTPSSNEQQFTHTLISPEAVSAGQTVSVEVEISFTSG